MNERTKRLHQLMTERNLSVRRVAELTGRTEQTVLIWRCQTDHSRTIPAQLLELLELKCRS